MARRGEPRSGESRLARWVRRKREATAEKTKEAERREAPEEAKTAALAPAAPPPEAGRTDERKKTEDVTKDLPPLESLGKDSDYTLFMREGVPDETRVAALRKLWRSDPAFTEPFPFEMHMEDYNKTFTPINAATDTLFRAGLGYLFDEDDKAKTDKPPGAEMVDKSAPAQIEAGGAENRKSAESIPPAKEEMDKTGMAPATAREETSEDEKSSSGKPRSG